MGLPAKRRNFAAFTRSTAGSSAHRRLERILSPRGSPRAGARPRPQVPGEHRSISKTSRLGRGEQGQPAVAGLTSTALRTRVTPDRTTFHDCNELRTTPAPRRPRQHSSLSLLGFAGLQVHGCKKVSGGDNDNQNFPPALQAPEALVYGAQRLLRRPPRAFATVNDRG